MDDREAGADRDHGPDVEGGRAGGSGGSSPSWQHRAVVVALRVTQTKRLLDVTRTRGTDAEGRAGGRRVVPPRWAVRGLRAEPGVMAGLPVWTLAPRTSRVADSPVVVGLHGGAYVREIAVPHWQSYARLVRSSGARVVVPIYPLAPRGTAGVVVPQVADLLATLVREHGAAAVGVLGDSAGGGLALAAVQELVRRGEPTPAGLVLISPWLDVTMTDPAGREVDDPMLDPDSLVDCGRLWAGDLDPADPRVSPLHGSLERLPPTQVYAGTRDVLYPDALRMHERAQRQGAPVTVDLRRDLVHVWAGIAVLPEARSVQPQIVGALVGDRT